MRKHSFNLIPPILSFASAMAKHGIYLVANRNSEPECENLVYSIRKAGCLLPIALIPFGGKPVSSRRILSEVSVIKLSSFPEEAHSFLDYLSDVLTECPSGYLRRFLAYFGPYDYFLYSDNDIVALSNWSKLFELSAEHDLIHADQEYTTFGKYSFHQPQAISQLFGSSAMAKAITAGHFLSRRSEEMVSDILKAVAWMKDNPGICISHDQAMIHIASLIGRWSTLNLCRPPHNWLSSWAGDYPNTLTLIQQIQSGRRISHLHYSGRSVRHLAEPVDELLLSGHGKLDRQRRLLKILFLEFLGWPHLIKLKRGIQRRLR